MSTIARGPRQVRAQLMNLMRSELPPALAVYRDHWGIEAAALPDPVHYDNYEKPVLDTLPMLALNLARARDFTRRDVNALAAEQYQVRYQGRMFAWIKQQEMDVTEAARDDYSTVMSYVLLATPGLNGDGAFRLEENTVEVSYSDVSRVRGDRYVAGCSVAFDVYHDESVRRVPLGNAAHIDLQASVLSAEHPGME